MREHPISGSAPHYTQDEFHTELYPLVPARLTLTRIFVHVSHWACRSFKHCVYAMVYALVVAAPEVLSFREFRAGLAGVLDRVRRSPDAAVFVGAHRRAEAVLVSVEQYEALQEAAERQHAVAAALASVRAEGLEPSAEDLALFAEVAAGRLSTDELRERVLSRYRR
jgi:PHD/YefM family antitoxin component YafN of YafNO toxin-antitoxin module